MGKVIPELYDALMAPLERIKFRSIRQSLIQKAEGKVLEIGSGTGLNFPYYTKAEAVTAVEPNSVMLRKSKKRIKAAQVPIEAIQADAQKLPFSDDSFDMIVGTLVFCTIPHPDIALKELRRVLKTDGTLLVFEHVRLDRPTAAKMQKWVTPVWKRMCDGCHLDRNTLANIKKSGMTVEQVKKYNSGLFLAVQAKN
ncbi:class I SAM-dependent methyltransferase [Salipaludibacillus sp. CUR1]|uniref:class I SAM-dependent methyltransferase n=1 Tax=Salipaludibacillus sp. CUR1 TaxID=2820003 RepID=UPI001E2976EF|nr:class I SAM-dependent methyltransferase [Salipaludibacillus sp. CUR1]